MTCEKGIRLKKETGKIPLEYGSWLKAEPKQRSTLNRARGGFHEKTPFRPMSNSKQNGTGGGGSAAGGRNSGGSFVEIERDTTVIPGEIGREFKFGEEGKLAQSSKLGRGQFEPQQISEVAEKFQEDRRKVSDENEFMPELDKVVSGSKEKVLVDPCGSSSVWTEPNAFFLAPNAHPQPKSTVGPTADLSKKDMPIPSENMKAQTLLIDPKNSWKRKPREGPFGKDIMIGEDAMVQKKRKLPGEKGGVQDSNGDKKRRVLGDLNNHVAEADVQPRCTQ